jgi:hypothetical protein
MKMRVFDGELVKWGLGLGFVQRLDYLAGDMVIWISGMESLMNVHDGGIYGVQWELLD